MYDMFIVSLGDDQDRVDALRKRFPHARATRFYRDIYGTVIRCVEHCRTSHMWIVMACSACDSFDFEYEPNVYETHQIHCWSAGEQKFGDILLIPINDLKEQGPERLEWFHDVNYHADGPGRHAWPAFFIGDQDLTTSVKQTMFNTEYAWFVTGNNVLPSTYKEPALWGEKHHELISFASDNSVNLVPRDAKTKVKTQIYDYYNLQRRRQVDSQTQDIVFISYDEPQADENYAILQARFPQARRVHGVEGMENALQAAARVSTTPWFFATFAKTRLHEDWDFGFVPDRWQAPKHYIFNALNTSNDLCYGHMGIILYHKETVLNAPAWDDINGMDYTMSFDTESIPLTSVYGEFATDPYRAWRTAFRETAKLVQWYLDEKCVETQYRLKVWQTHAHGPYASWVLRGAKDGIAYYNEHLMDHGALKQMFRWDWLKNYFVELYGAPGQLLEPPADSGESLSMVQCDA